MRNSTTLAAIVAALAMASLTACQQAAAPKEVAPAVKPPTEFKLVAGIQDIMALEVDPAADALWDSVSTVVSKSGTKDNHPNTDREWEEMRSHAIILTEAANLLMMEGRHVAREGVQKLDDHGTPGNFSAEQSQQAIDANRATFVSFATGLRGVGEEMLKAIEAKNPQALMDAGATMDKVCEGCHLKFWYPGQKIPRFPDEAPEVDLPESAQTKTAGK